MEENEINEPITDDDLIFIEETGLDENEVKEHYRDISINTWESWHHYREEMEKIIFFGGTVFLTIISATGLFSAFTKSEIASTFQIYHVIIFHFIFLIFILAFMYKKLICDTAFAIAMWSDEYYQKRYKEPLDNKFVFISIKHKFTKDGRILLKAFNGSIFLVYIIITGFPFISSNNGELHINWSFIFVLLGFLVLLGIITYFSGKEIKKVKRNVAKEWVEHINKLENK
jgi:hypothetical protein